MSCDSDHCWMEQDGLEILGDGQALITSGECTIRIENLHYCPMCGIELMEYEEPDWLEGWLDF